ncbi:hypothetical protein ACF1BQ_004985 [Bradyrhizobium sp. RDT10]
MPTDDEIDRSLVEFAQKIAAIPKRIADESPSAESAAEASRAAPPTAAEVGSESLPPRFPPAINPIRTLSLPCLPTQAANRFVAQKKSQASS